jgi:hypothetical protein
MEEEVSFFHMLLTIMSTSCFAEDQKAAGPFSHGLETLKHERK